MSKNYAVVLAEGVERLFPVSMSSFIRTSQELHYFLASEIDANGTFFYMVLRESANLGIPTDFQLHIPHGYIRYILATKDEKLLGFF
ncbi:MAG: hypothetical protein HY254_10135 [Burkholderiales bacterium]|nr:hypothetical protein [Burkholderiales bacterium]